MTNYSQKIPEKFIKRLIDLGFTELDSRTGYTWIPTYGEVFDWFSQNKGIIITLEPFHTFALKGRIGYTWKISFINDSGYNEITEEDNYRPEDGFGGSFTLVADDVIEYVLIMGHNSEKIK